MIAYDHYLIITKYGYYRDPNKTDYFPISNSDPNEKYIFRHDCFRDIGADSSQRHPHATHNIKSLTARGSSDRQKRILSLLLHARRCKVRRY